MITRLLIGVAIGALIGALLGSTRSCAGGGCPLTATPGRGAVWGGLLGLMLAFSVAPTQARSPGTTDPQTGRSEESGARTYFAPGESPGAKYGKVESPRTQSQDAGSQEHHHD